MQAPGGRPDALLEPALDVHVHVLERALEPHGAALDLGQHLIEAFEDLARIGLADDALGGKHCRMRL